MKARPYQEQAIAAIESDLKEADSTLLVMATGLGKTVTFGHIAKRFGECGRVLILAHREELIRQAADKVGRITGRAPEVEMAGEWADQPNLSGDVSPFVVSTVQTQISGMGGRGRMTRFVPNEFSLVIVDEAHHATADSYKKVLAYYRQNKGLKVLGVTATPDRADEEALGQVFDRVAFVYEINNGITDGWLVPIEQRMVHVGDLDFSRVRSVAGDLNPGDLAAVMEAEGPLHGIAHPTFEMAAGRKTLVFAASIAHAERLCEIFNRWRPASARFVCGTTDDVERRKTLRDYKAGSFQFLVNCGVFTEGFDEPSIEVVAVARPTKSRALYCQMVGRGTRPLDGIVDGVEGEDDADGMYAAQARREVIRQSRKPTLEVLDFVGNAGRHKLMSCADILGGEYPDEVVDLAAAKARAAQRPVDMQMLLAEASQEMKRRQIEEANRRRDADAATRKPLIGTAQYTTVVVDAFDVLDVTPSQSGRGWDKGRKATSPQVECLRKFGIPNPQELGKADAHALIGKCIERARDKKCTFKMARLLKKHGYNPDMSFAEARTTIDALAANGWRRPDEQADRAGGWTKAPQTVRSA